MLATGEVDYTTVGSRIALGVQGLAKAAVEVVTQGVGSNFSTGVGELKYGFDLHGPFYSFGTPVTLTGTGASAVASVSGYPFVAWEVTTAESGATAVTVRIYAEGEVRS